MSVEEFDLAESEKAIGQLHPIILSKDGEVVDGLHRKQVNPDWRSEVNEAIDTEEKYWLARAHANLGRRNVGDEEKRDIINKLASIYELRGMSIARKKHIKGPTGGTLTVYENEVMQEIIKVLKGCMGNRVIYRLIDPKYIQQERGEKIAEAAERRRRELGALERFRRDRKAMESRYGEGFVEELVEDAREKAKEELKTDTGFREDVKKYVRPEVKAEVREEVVEEVKEELRRDEEFVEEVAEEYRKKKVDELLSRVLGKERVDIEPRRISERYLDMVTSTFYKVRGWGVPMILSMGRGQWDRALPYVRGIHDWTGFLLMIKPEKPLDQQPAEPRIAVHVDESKIVEAEYQIMEEG